MAIDSYRDHIFLSTFHARHINHPNSVPIVFVTTSSKSVILLLPLTCHIPVRPGRKDIRALWYGSYNSHSSTVGGLVPKYVK